MTRQKRSRQFRQAWSTLTPREREVIARRCQGKTNREIADNTFTSRWTIKNHACSAARKLKAVIGEHEGRGATQLNVVCFRLGYETALVDVRGDTAELEQAA